MKKVRVLVVDDSALMRRILSELLSSDPEIEVVGSASDPKVARAKIAELAPDVLTLDVEMPKEDGVSFLADLMQTRPMPVLMVSSLTERGCETTLRALELGAFDFVTKPKLDLERSTVVLGAEIVDKVKAAARSRVGRAPRRPTPAAPRAAAMTLRTTQKVIAIGASTGGTEAIREVLTALPPNAPPTVIVQHMPRLFTCSFAKRLDSLCRVRVKEASDGDVLVDGHVLIAPGGDTHLEIVRSGATYGVRLVKAPPVAHHRPSVDVMFTSCARAVGPNAVGAILTGMGSDGARGLLAMRRAGAKTFAEDESTCVVFGMPKEAIACGAAAQVLPIERMASALLRATQEIGGARRMEEKEGP